MYVLGIHTDTHDSGVSLLKEGKIISAINEERLSRVKMDERTPFLSLKETIEKNKVNPAEIEYVVFSGFSPGIKKIWGFQTQQLAPNIQTGFYMIMDKIKKNGIINGIYRESGLYQAKKAIDIAKEQKGLIKYLKSQGFVGKIRYVEHNLCHLASVYYTSGWKEPILCINTEGSSFYNSQEIAFCENGKIKIVAKTKWPNSAGQFYRLITQILGFKPRKHAGKITGLAAFGDYKKNLSQVKGLLKVSNLELKMSSDVYRLRDEYENTGKIPTFFGEEPKREDLAAAFQYVLEKRIVSIVRNAIKKFKRKYKVEKVKIGLVGGVHANVKLNQRINELDEVDEIWVYPAMGDAGQAAGAALYHYYSLEQNESRAGFRLEDVYLGPEFGEKEIELALEKTNMEYVKERNVEKKVAGLITENKIIALFQGRMEYGPRALGNRSILYNPEDKSVNNWLNKQLNRTEFMPFAPVTLWEKAETCYPKIKSKHSAEFMTVAFDVSEEMKITQPAVVHIDNTARPQLIKRKTNKTYYDILKNFYNQKGIPSIVNTSFNMHEEPIVCTPLEAINSFQQGNLDVLVLGRYMIEKG